MDREIGRERDVVKGMDVDAAQPIDRDDGRRRVTDADADAHFREHFASLGLPDDLRSGAWLYEEARPAYELGLRAARDPQNAARQYEELDRELEEAWAADMRTRLGDFDLARPMIRAGYEYGARARGAVPHDETLGGTPQHDRPSYSDPIEPR
jgi:hypothetical protein